MSFVGIKDFSEELTESMHWAQTHYEETIKRGLTNAAVQRSRREISQKKEKFQIQNVFFNVDENTTVHLKDLNLLGMPDILATSVKCNMAAMTLNMDLNLGTLRLEGLYETTNTLLSRILPVTSVGKIKITLDNVQARGNIGTQIKSDTLTTPTLDFVYTPQEVTVEVEYAGHNGVTVSSVTHTDAEKTIVRKFWRQLTYIFNKIINSQVSDVITEISLLDFVQQEADALNELRDHVNKVTTIANNMADTVLAKAKLLVSRQAQTSAVTTAFRRRAVRGGVHVGQFATSAGIASPLTFLRRRGDAFIVTVKDDNGNDSGKFKSFYLLTHVEFPSLTLGYGDCRILQSNITTDCHVKMKIYPNTALVRIRLKINEKQYYRAEFKDFKIYDNSCEDLDVCGLGSFNYLIPEIKTWLLGTFWDKTVPKIENECGKAIKKVLDNVVFDIIEK